MVLTSILSKSISVKQLKIKAQGLGINPGKMKKTELIRSIQKAEGFSPCFGTTNGYCSQDACCFRNDCLKTKA